VFHPLCSILQWWKIYEFAISGLTQLRIFEFAIPEWAQELAKIAWQSLDFRRFSKNKLHLRNQGTFLATWDQYLLFLDVNWKTKYHETEKHPERTYWIFFADMGSGTVLKQFNNKLNPTENPSIISLRLTPAALHFH
jgi:hypothetical protein